MCVKPCLSLCATIHTLHTSTKLRLCCHCWHPKDSLLWDYGLNAWGCVAFFSVFASPAKRENIILRYCFIFLAQIVCWEQNSTSQFTKKKQFWTITAKHAYWLRQITTAGSSNEISGYTACIHHHTYSSITESFLLGVDFFLQSLWHLLCCVGICRCTKWSSGSHSVTFYFSSHIIFLFLAVFPASKDMLASSLL